MGTPRRAPAVLAAAVVLLLAALAPGSQSEARVAGPARGPHDSGAASGVVKRRRLRQVCPGVDARAGRDTPWAAPAPWAAAAGRVEPPPPPPLAAMLKTGGLALRVAARGPPPSEHVAPGGGPAEVARAGARGGAAAEAAGPRGSGVRAKSHPATALPTAAAGHPARAPPLAPRGSREPSEPWLWPWPWLWLWRAAAAAAGLLATVLARRDGPAHGPRRSERARHSPGTRLACTGAALLWACVAPPLVYAQCTSCHPSPSGAQIVCTRPVSHVGYATPIETELNVVTGFVVTSSCAANYQNGAGVAQGAAVVSACTTAGAYSLSGCTAIVCTRPAVTTGYAVTTPEANLDLSSGTFAVSAICATGWEGTAAATQCGIVGFELRCGSSTVSIWGCSTEPACGASPQETHEVGCCSDTMIPSWRAPTGSCQVYGGRVAQGADNQGSTCEHDLDFAAAGAYCATIGGRLCTASELEANCTLSTGCGHDHDLLWSSTPTSIGQAANPATYGAYSLSGCAPIVCTRPAVTTGYSTISETGLDLSSGVVFAVSATCASGWEGMPVATACAASGEYTLLGCTAIVCTSPVTHGCITVESETNLDLSSGSFDVSADCADGCDGTAIATACTTSGAYTLGGCTAIVCTTPQNTTGYNTAEINVDLSTGDFDVAVSCADGYDEVAANMTWTALWSKTGQQQTTASSAWLLAQLSVSPTVNSVLRIKAVTGSTDRSDMAIDSVGVRNGLAAESFEQTDWDTSRALVLNTVRQNP